MDTLIKNNFNKNVQWTLDQFKDAKNKDGDYSCREQKKTYQLKENK